MIITERWIYRTGAKSESELHLLAAAGCCLTNKGRRCLWSSFSFHFLIFRLYSQTLPPSSSPCLPSGWPPSPSPKNVLRMAQGGGVGGDSLHPHDLARHWYLHGHPQVKPSGTFNWKARLTYLPNESSMISTSRVINKDFMIEPKAMLITSGLGVLVNIVMGPPCTSMGIGGHHHHHHHHLHHHDPTPQPWWWIKPWPFSWRSLLCGARSSQQSWQAQSVLIFVVVITKIFLITFWQWWWWHVSPDI